jgi:hypothetical protein
MPYDVGGEATVIGVRVRHDKHRQVRGIGPGVP